MAVVMSRTAVFIWTAAIFFLNQVFDALRGVPAGGNSDAASDLAAVGVFQYMAWYAIFRLLTSSDRVVAARRLDVFACAALSLLVLAPTSRMIWIAATGVAAYLWCVSPGDGKSRSAGMVLAALAIQEFWGHLFFELFSYPLLRAETAVVGMIVEATRTGAVWRGNVIVEPGGHAIVVLAACSSFHNLSIALLCWVTISRLRNQDWRPRDLYGGLMVVATMISLNGARLYLMALDADDYRYWHDGTGSQIFLIGVSVIVLMMALFGARPAVARA
jgi:Transmembrane exosortase (Exosortase_EpsH)